MTSTPSPLGRFIGCWVVVAEQLLAKMHLSPQAGLVGDQDP